MTAVVERPLGTTATAYRRNLPSGVVAIAAVSGVVAVWAVLVLATISMSLGFLCLACAAAFACIDAEFATPTNLDVTEEGITLGYWHRARSFGRGALVVTHDVRRNHFSIRRRGKKRVLARFRANDADVVRTFVAAGVEVLSR